MTLANFARLALSGGMILILAACGGNSTGSDGSGERTFATGPNSPIAGTTREREERARSGTIWGMFRSEDPNVTVEVNKYLWQASLEVLNFLPVETVDPFTGVIVTGYGRPPGGGRAYRATIYVQDPALEARSLRVSLQSQGGGAVAPETVRAVEDAILTRARQLRVRDSRL